MADEFEKPDTSRFVLKPKAVERTDPVSRPDDPEAISVQSIHRQNLRAEEARRRGANPLGPAGAEAPPPGFKRPELAPLNPPARAGDPEAIAVPELLRANTAAERESGWGEYQEPRRRKSRRWRDYLMIVGPLDLLLGGVMYFQRGNPVAFIFALGAITLLTSTFAWIMFFVMDDY